MKKYEQKFTPKKPAGVWFPYPYAAKPEETPASTAAPTQQSVPSEQSAAFAKPTENPKIDAGSNKTFPVFAIVISVIGITALAAAIVVMIVLLVRKRKNKSE